MCVCVWLCLCTPLYSAAERQHCIGSTMATGIVIVIVEASFSVYWCKNQNKNNTHKKASMCVCVCSFLLKHCTLNSVFMSCSQKFYCMLIFCLFQSNNSDKMYFLVDLFFLKQTLSLSLSPSLIFFLFFILVFMFREGWRVLFKAIQYLCIHLVVKDRTRFDLWFLN